MRGDLFDYLRWTFLFGKYSGLLPISGLESSREIPRFSWKSVCTIIYVVNFCVLIYVVGMQTYNLGIKGIEMTRFNLVMLFIVHFIMSILLIRYCIRFNGFVLAVRSLEKLLPPMRKPRSSVRHINRFFIFILFLGLGNHLIALSYSINLTNLCFRLPGDSGWYTKSIFSATFSWYFDHFPFSYVAAFVFQVIKTQCSITWFYGDWLVMAVSIYLKDRFDDFNRLIIDKKSLFTRNFKPSWSELQVHYTRLSKLTAIFDQYLSALVFSTYTSNLYFVCLDFYAILNDLVEVGMDRADDCISQTRTNVLTIVFKMYNMVSVTMRTVIVSYLASEVNVSSRKSLTAIHSIPPSECNGDMQRLMTQIFYSNLGISGLNFFTITRGMLLAMVAKLLTYELVVVQF